MGTGEVPRLYLTSVGGDTAAIARQYTGTMDTITYKNQACVSHVRYIIYQYITFACCSRQPRTSFAYVRVFVPIETLEHL